MHLILTHEQADFDAMASLLAASLLDPAAQAVLPRRLNRNVRAFLTLYGREFPFLEFDDLPRERVEHVTLVDTQSLTTVKGMGPWTDVQVVDHHPPDPDLDPSWSIHLEEMGANTTLFVEALEEAGVNLSFLPATLLLLGIYEDTGSLNYPSTTPRDVRACAYLLELGASLNIAADFLDHPLSADQRKLYNQLLESAETHHFHGLSVIIACAEAEGIIDEISTVAHKLRDLFDPDGLFVIVALDSRVQMVARSTTKSLDVSQIAAHFGGGGHSRAAAALIRNQPIVSICDELLSILPQHIQPTHTVGQIMSRGPQLLSPDVTIGEASERMKRFGHEGYPVVQEGTVIGLLTRRAVDRAMAHGMEARSIASVMDAGRIVVQPDDSVQHLQRVMTSHGWGQIPVEDPNQGEIIGIVTRTDLLKTLGSEVESRPMLSLAPQIEEALPPSRLRLLKLVAKAAEENDAALYIVGGFVRDLLLGAPSVDFDLVVEGDAIQLAQDLASTYGGRVSSHRRFGTAKWRLDLNHPALNAVLEMEGVEEEDLPATLDFVTARTEFYTYPTALPSVRSGSIKLDLHRRDFTINTLALRLDGSYYGRLLDHWGGRRDLEERQIKVLHSLSFVDDPTRMLRAARLEQRLDFEIEPRTLQLLHEALPLLNRVSGDRIRHELAQIFMEDPLLRIMNRLDSLELLTAIHPSLKWDSWLERGFGIACHFVPPPAWKLSSVPSRELLLYMVWLSRVTENEAQEICERLHLPLSMIQPIFDANRVYQAPVFEAEVHPPSIVVSILQNLQEEGLVGAWIAMADRPNAKIAIERYLSHWRHIYPIADGEILRKHGLPPGPAYRRILWSLRAAWLDGEIEDAEGEDQLLTRLLKQEVNGG